MVDAAHRNLVLSRVASAVSNTNKTLKELQDFAVDYMSMLSLPDEEGFVDEADMQQDNGAWWDVMYR